MENMGLNEGIVLAIKMYGTTKEGGYIWRQTKLGNISASHVIPKFSNS
jgi:hypothetical protein